MATQAQIEANIAALEAALASGEHRVRYDGREVEFRSVDEIKKALAYWQDQLAVATGTLRRRVNFTDAPRQKGWV